jgi:hypothetical protein
MTYPIPRRKGTFLLPDKPKAAIVISAAAIMAVFTHRPASLLAKAGEERFRDATSHPGFPVPPPLPHGLHFPWAGDFSEGLAPVQIGNRFGFIDTSGNLRIAAAFDRVGAFSGGLAPFLENGKWGYVDVTGGRAIPPAYGYAGPFREGLAPVATDSGYGYIDREGRPVGGMGYADARPYSEGLAAVKVDYEDYGAWGFVDKRGEFAIPPLFNDVGAGFSEGLAVVTVESEMPYRAGFIDTSGGFAMDTLFDAAGDFHEGRAPVGRGEWRGNRFEGKWGYVESSGRLATPLAYSSAGPFRDGKALVRLAGGGNAWIDRDGRILRAYREDLEVLRPQDGDLVTYKLRKGCGFLDSLGREPLGNAFTDAGSFRCGWARVRLPAKGPAIWGYIGRDGRYLDSAGSAPAD